MFYVSLAISKQKNKSVTGKKIELAEVKEGKLDFGIVEKQQTLEVDKKTTGNNRSDKGPI